MLLSAEVSLYCPRFVVMELKDARPRVVYAAMNDHRREASMAQRRRAPPGNVLLEIADKLSFILTAYPVTDAVWYMRSMAAANQEAAQVALGAILLTLEQHGVSADEMIRSRMQLLLTGNSKANTQMVSRTLTTFLQEIPETYSTACAYGIAWFCNQHMLHPESLARGH